MGVCPFLNGAIHKLAARTAQLKLHPDIHLGRVTGLYETNFYYIDRVARSREKAEEAAIRELLSLMETDGERLERAATFVQKLYRRLKLRKGLQELTSPDASPLVTRRAGDAATGRANTPSPALHRQPSDGSCSKAGDGSFKKSRSRRARRGSVSTDTMREAEEIASLGGDPHGVPSKKVGYSNAFVRLLVGMSYFSVDKIAYLAANDFLRNPMLMICTYLEWAAAATAVARSGRLSLASSKIILEFAETLVMSPAACLDYIDAIYINSDPDGEYAGFPLSGHLLRNESIISRSDPEYEHYPLMLVSPLGPIQVARVLRGTWFVVVARAR